MFKTQISPSTRRSWSRSNRKRRRGQTLVETTLCLVFILLPLFGAGLQFAVIINAAHSLNEIAREGARFAAVHGGESTFDDAVTQANPPSYRYYIKMVCTKTAISYADLTFTVPAAVSSGQGITATFSYPMTKKMILIPAKWNETRYGFTGQGQSNGNYMETLAKPYVVSSTFMKE